VEGCSIEVGWGVLGGQMEGDGVGEQETIWDFVLGVTLEVKEEPKGLRDRV
jgi:hypothetical protein